MKIKKILITTIIALSFYSCYTRLAKIEQNRPISDAIIGKWSKTIIDHDQYGMPLISDRDFYIKFNSDGTHNANVVELKGYYKVKEDTLVVYDDDMANSMFFILEVYEGDYLRLTPINRQNKESDKFTFYGGKWNWW